METAIETGDVKAYYSYQNRFHDIYIQKSGNQEHKTIINLFKKRNGAELEQFLRCKHWNPELAFYDTL
ncbi:MAG: hypothetical protein JRC87_07520 [Deltaproteobacteria bacterium]|nr:hypothetical protein [Deltaproteobacteria bacterium]MBW2659422.1 hypothetical protein [Deltaproteobacteria bacterium]